MNKMGKFAEFVFKSIRLETSIRTSGMFKDIDSKFNDDKAIFTIQCSSFSNASMTVSIGCTGDINPRGNEVFTVEAKLDVASNTRTTTKTITYIPTNIDELISIITNYYN